MPIQIGPWRGRLFSTPSLVRTAPLLTILALAIVPAAEAVELDGSGNNYGAHVGWVRDADAEDGNMLFGGHLEAVVFPWLGVQGSIDYRSDDVYNVSIAGEDQKLTVKTIPVMVTGRLYLPGLSGFAPFAAAGVGWHHQAFDFSQRLEDGGIDDVSRTQFGWHVGLGARIAVAPRVSVYGEGRYVFIDPDGKFTGDVRDDLEEIDYDSTYLSGGVNLHF